MHVDVGLLGWRAVEWLRRSLSRFAEVHGGRQSAAIAYYVLLSLFPLILFLASVAGLVLKDEQLRADFVSAPGGRAADHRVGQRRYRRRPSRRELPNAGTVGLISLVTLLWTASGMMGAIRGSLDDMDQTPPRPSPRTSWSTSRWS